MTVDQLAAEFIKHNGRKPAHRSVEIRYPMGDAVEYRLHDNIICRQYEQGGELFFDWCGWYTPTTARHMNAILKAAGHAKRVSYAAHRDEGVEAFTSRA